MVKIFAALCLTTVMVAAAMFSDENSADRLGVAGHAAQAITAAMRTISMDPAQLADRDDAGSPGPDACATGLCAGGLPTRGPPASP